MVKTQYDADRNLIGFEYRNKDQEMVQYSFPVPPYRIDLAKGKDENLQLVWAIVFETIATLPDAPDYLRKQNNAN